MCLSPHRSLWAFGYSTALAHPARTAEPSRLDAIDGCGLSTPRHSILLSVDCMLRLVEFSRGCMVAAAPTTDANAPVLCSLPTRACGARAMVARFALIRLLDACCPPRRRHIGAAAVPFPSALTSICLRTDRSHSKSPRGRKKHGACQQICWVLNGIRQMRDIGGSVTRHIPVAPAQPLRTAALIN
jgi:hypothetical protein